MLRFNIDKGKLILSDKGEYLYISYHEEIINKLYSNFLFGNIKIPEIYSITKNNKIIKNKDLQEEEKEDLIHTGLILYSEHEKILQDLEKSIFK